MTDKAKRWVRNVGDSKNVEFAGMHTLFPGHVAIPADEDVAMSAQYRYAPQLEMVTEEQAIAFNTIPEPPAEVAAAENEGLPPAAPAETGAELADRVFAAVSEHREERLGAPDINPNPETVTLLDESGKQDTYVKTAPEPPAAEQPKASAPKPARKAAAKKRGK